MTTMLIVTAICSSSLDLSVSLRFNGHFSRWTWVSWYQYVSILDFIATKDDESGGDNWSL